MSDEEIYEQIVDKLIELGFSEQSEPHNRFGYWVKGNLRVSIFEVLYETE